MIEDEKSDTRVTYRFVRAIVAAKARNTASPPIRGIGVVWTFRSDGTSTAPRRTPSRFTRG